jgi:hypothetical protein
MAASQHILNEIDKATKCPWTLNSRGSHSLVALLERTNQSQCKGWLRNLVCKGPPHKRFSSEERESLSRLGPKIPESVVGQVRTLLGFAWGSKPVTLKKFLGNPIATEGVESFAVSKTLAESRGIEVEVEGEAVATTITPTPKAKANTRSFFEGEVVELDRLVPVGGRCNKDDEGFLDTHSSDHGKRDSILQLPDEDEADEEQEEEPDEELEPSLGETSDTADPNRPNRTTTIRTEPTLALPIPPESISREQYESFEIMRTHKKGDDSCSKGEKEDDS